MAIAPSEKHLEDWIVKHPRYFGTPRCLDEQCDKYEIDPFVDEILFRQFKLPSGIPDILAADGPYMRVMELKVGVITAEAVIQVMKYIEDLRAVWNATENKVMFTAAKNLHNKAYGKSPYLHAYKLRGVLVGHGVKNDAIHLACRAIDVDIIQYEYVPEHDFYFFDYASRENDDSNVPECYRIADGELGTSIIKLIRLSHLEMEAKERRGVILS